MLEDLRSDPDCYGVLRPRDSRLTLKSVSKETALLLAALRETSEMPTFAAQALGARFDTVIAQMALDGIIEIESEGEMLSGPAALKIVAGVPRAAAIDAPLAALSNTALRYADALAIEDPLTLSQRLYAYNSVPISARWHRLLHDYADVETFLGVHDRTVTRTLDAHWVRVTSRDDVWIAWLRRGRRPLPKSETYKIYVSPACHAVPSSFPAVLHCLSQSSCAFWKVGNSVHGLLRPDKLVAYFDDLVDLRDAALLLLEELRGVPAQGVPFSGELGAGALLSWGVDPPGDEHTVPWLRHQSWRVMICNRLGASIALCKHSTGGVAIRFAMERLRLDGIDPDSWTPAA